MRLRAILVIVLLWPLRAFRFMAGLTGEMFRSGGVSGHRRGRAVNSRRDYPAGGRWQDVHRRIRAAGKRTRSRR